MVFLLGFDPFINKLCRIKPHITNINHNFRNILKFVRITKNTHKKLMIIINYYR